MASKTSESSVRVGEEQTGEGLRVGQEVDGYDCGCDVSFRQVDYGEAETNCPEGHCLCQTMYLARNTNAPRVFLLGCEARQGSA